MNEPRLYPLYRYDDTFHLKIPPLLWLVMFLGLRHLAVHVFATLQIVGGDWAEVIYDWRFLISDTLILPLLIAAGYRVREAPAIARAIWRRGRTILLLAYVLEITLLFGVYQEELLRSAYHMTTFAGILVLDVLVITYLAGSRLVRDVFADFPERAPQADSRAT